MRHLKFQEGERHQLNNGAVEVTEFHFDNAILNDATISLHGRYPDAGYAVNTVSTVIISVEQGEADIYIKDAGVSHVNIGDRVLIEPQEPYCIEPFGTFVMRYIATPAWTPAQAQHVDEKA